MMQAVSNRSSQEKVQKIASRIILRAPGSRRVMRLINRKLGYGELDFYINYLGGMTRFDKVKIREEFEISEDYDDYHYLRPLFRQYSHLHPLRKYSYIDFKTYLPNQILRKVDISSMKYSIEARVPFMDRSIVEFSLKLPVTWLVDASGRGKKILRELKVKLPESLRRGEKFGFSIPKHILSFSDNSARHKNENILDQHFSDFKRKV